MRVLPSLIAGIMLANVQLASAGDAPKYARLCASGDRELPAATTRLMQLDHAIESAADDAPSGPLVKELNSLLAMRCFEVAASEHLDLSKTTTIALKRWWKDGGHEWLAGQLSGQGSVTFPPSVRATLSLEHAPKHPLARLLCRAADRSCGTETAGWVARAENAFRARAKLDARWRGDGYTVNLYARKTPPKEDDAANARSQTLDVPLWRCANPATGKRDYETWKDCVSALRTSVAMFPVGAVRAPTSGWLVIRGRRGHYQFCDQLSAFDLATGSYYASKSCSGLALQSDGSVNAQRTDAARKPAVEAGRVSVDNLREAAWMMFLAKEIDERGYDQLDSFPIPPGLEPKVEVGVVRGMAFSAWSSSAQTTLTWSWVDGAQMVAEGTVTWPDSYRAADDHAVELLRVVEAGRVPGCPPAPLPNPILTGCGKGGVSAIDSSPASLCKVQAELSARLAGFTCKKR